MHRPLRLTIDRSAIQANWRWLAEHSGVPAGAAVKADGYGLGAREVTDALLEAGCRDFFVSTWAEAEALGNLPTNIVLHRLHGAIEPAQQRAALAPPRPGTRKLVLASAIAETSLTLDDVRIVVDSGLARRPRYDRGAGLTRLGTERASRAAVTQRAGRAARQGPGFAIRLWEEAATASLPAHDPPEILEADLSALLLACLMWGESDPARLPFLDRPPAAALAEARRRLTSLGALDADGQLTAHGRAGSRGARP